MTTLKLALELILLNVLPEHYINVHNVGNRFDCAFQCMYDVSCVSVVYNTESGSCYLYNQSISSNATGETDIKFIMYNTDRGNLAGLEEAEETVRLCLDIGYELHEVLDFCYKLHSDLKTSPEADAACKTEGGTGLAKLDTQEKVNLFTSMIPSGTYTHINGHREGNSWVYPAETTPDTTPFLQWVPGQPNGELTNQDCLAVDGEGIHDAFCDSRAEFPFICEM